MSTPNYNHLHYFHKVATKGSLSGAARELGLATSTLSEQVRQLEEWCGHALFERKPGGMTLTRHGQRALRHTSTMFTHGEMLAEELLGELPDSRPVLTIGVASSVSDAFAADFFLPLFKLEGQIPRITGGDHDYLVRKLVKLDLDIVVSDSLPVDPERLGIDTTLLHAPKLVAVASPQLAATVSDYPRGLSEQPVVAYSDSARAGFEVDSFFRSHGILLKSIGETDDVGIMCAVAKRGLAIAFVPESCITSELKSGDLVKLGEVDNIRARVVAMYNQRQSSERVQEAISQLTQGSTVELPEATRRALTES